MAGRLGVCERSGRGRNGRTGRDRDRGLDCPFYERRTGAHRSTDPDIRGRVARSAPRLSAAAAVEMPSPWTSQTEAHRDLEISPRPRDSHIPPLIVLTEI